MAQARAGDACMKAVIITTSKVINFIAGLREGGAGGIADTLSQGRWRPAIIPGLPPYTGRVVDCPCALQPSIVGG
jgi:hypothetical protein